MTHVQLYPTLPSPYKGEEKLVAPPSVPLLCKDGNFFRRGKSWEVDLAAGRSIQNFSNKATIIGQRTEGIFGHINKQVGRVRRLQDRLVGFARYRLFYDVATFRKCLSSG